MPRLATRWRSEGLAQASRQQTFEHPAWGNDFGVGVIWLAEFLQKEITGSVLDLLDKPLPTVGQNLILVHAEIVASTPSSPCKRTRQILHQVFVLDPITNHFPNQLRAVLDHTLIASLSRLVGKFIGWIRVVCRDCV